jgi:hypothetical protein
MARSAKDLQPLNAISEFAAPPQEPAASLWTDDFSNLAETLRWN